MIKDGKVTTARRWIAGLAVAAGLAATAPHLVAGLSSTRTIAFYNIHTKETISVLYKQNGQYVPEAMEKINWIMRDWRRNEQTKMDPQTIDILWEMHAELGSKEPIHVISGFRSLTTNDMLRRTVGGQASESQHVTGKAVDVTFPDVPLKQIRYAALVREQGGVGYYPTSGIPFVHVDTGRVRHWPRLPRYELALLFPNGSSKHAPADGGAISSDDVRVAQSKYRDLAVQVAAFFDMRNTARNGGASIQVADAGRPALPKSAPAKPAETKVAALAPLAVPAPVATPVTASAPKPAPRLVAEPKLVERPSRLVPSPTEDDRTGLNALVAMASLTANERGPKLLIGPTPAVRRSASAQPAPAAPPRAGTVQPAAAGETVSGQSTAGQALAAVLAPAGRPRTSWMQLASLDAGNSPLMSDGRVMSDAVPAGWGNGYAAAPAFDDEHPEELHYRPFPIAPLLTATASIDEPAISRMVAPDVVRIMQLLDQPNAVPPMRFLPGRQTAETMWAQQFQGQPVVLADASFVDGAEDLPTRLIPRSVKTTDAQ
jgi:uncharacterized protein YcbK (DUF882 family)